MRAQERGCPQPQRIERAAGSQNSGRHWQTESAAAGTAALRLGVGLTAWCQVDARRHREIHQTKEA